MSVKPKPVRTDHETYISIDAKKGDWPFLAVSRAPDEPKKFRIFIDCNDSATVGDGRWIAGLRLSEKRMRALRDFLLDVDLGDDAIE